MLSQKAGNEYRLQIHGALLCMVSSDHSSGGSTVALMNWQRGESSSVSDDFVTKPVSVANILAGFPLYRSPCI